LIKKYALGSLLVSGNGCPDKDGNLDPNLNYSNANAENWNKLAKKLMD
jgi:hypothetical protein